MGKLGSGTGRPGVVAVGCVKVREAGIGCREARGSGGVCK